MTNLTVRGTAGSLPRPSTEGENLRWVHWDPFREMAPSSTGEDFLARFAPAFEIKETKDGFVFKADLPGFKEKDIEITMTGNRLTVSGKREAEKEETTDTFYARECCYGAFTRAFTLPEGTDGNDNIRAELTSGVLTLHLPKRPELQPKRIEVKVGSKSKS
jgi:HSP20 family protein